MNEGANQVNDGNCAWKIDNGSGGKNVTKVLVNFPIKVFENVTSLSISINTVNNALADITLYEAASATTKFEDTLTATLTPPNATNKNVTWTADNENVQLVANGLKCTVKAKAVGDSIVTCTSQDTTNGTITDTCNVTVSAVPATPNVLYTLPQETTFNGTSDFVDTGVQLFKTDQDFTIIMDVTPNNPQLVVQSSLIHCMKEQAPYKGMTIQSFGTTEGYVVSAGNNTSPIRGNNPGYLAPLGERTKLIIVKNGTTMKVYNSNNFIGESPYVFTSIDQTLLLGAYQDISGNKGRFFKGTIHEFSIIKGVYTEEQIKNYLEIVNKGERIFKIDSTCMNTESNELTDNVSGIEATLVGTPTVSNNQIVFTENDKFNFDLSSLNLILKDRTFRIKFTPTTLSNTNKCIYGIGAAPTDWSNITSAYISDSKLIMQHGSKFINNSTVGASNSQGNRLPEAPTINTEYEIVITEQFGTSNIRWFINGTLVQDGITTLYNPSALGNTEGTNRFIGSYSLIEIYDGFCDTYEDFTNMVNLSNTEQSPAVYSLATPTTFNGKVIL